MPCRELLPSTYSGAIAADWNPKDDAACFYHAVQVRRLTAAQAREDIGYTDRQAELMHAAVDEGKDYEHAQIDRVLAKRRKTLMLFERLMLTGGHFAPS